MHSLPSSLSSAWFSRLNARPLPSPAQLAGEVLLWDGLRLGVWGGSSGAEMPDVELASMLHPLACDYGFMLFVGASPALRDRARPLLDALAPAPGAWLWCGPTGSAQFCQRVFDAVLHIHGPQLGAQLPPNRLTPDWPAFFASQLTLSAMLLALAQDYRLRYQDSGELALPALLKDLAQPPAMHTHYALTLARLLVLALSQQSDCQAVFSQLFGQHGAGA